MLSGFLKSFHKKSHKTHRHGFSVMRIADNSSDSGQKLSRRCLSLHISKPSLDIIVGVVQFLVLQARYSSIV